MPNPWDLGSAHVLAQLGFPALATTSAGFAWSLGKPDNGVTLAEALTHMRAIAERVEIPVNADFEGGFAIEPETVGRQCRVCSGNGCRRTFNRRLHGGPHDSAVRFCAFGGTRARRACGTRQERELRSAHRPFRRLHRRAA